MNGGRRLLGGVHTGCAEDSCRRHAPMHCVRIGRLSGSGRACCVHMHGSKGLASMLLPWCFKTRSPCAICALLMLTGRWRPPAAAWPLTCDTIQCHWSPCLASSANFLACMAAPAAQPLLKRAVVCNACHKNPPVCRCSTAGSMPMYVARNSRQHSTCTQWR